MPVIEAFLVAGIFIFIIILAGGAALVYKFREKLGITKTPAHSTIQPADTNTVVKFKQYRLLSPKAYFHNSPDEGTKRLAWLANPGDTITALKEANDFIYTEYYNRKNQLSKGWLRKKDLVALDKFSNSTSISPSLANAENNTNEDELGRAANLYAGDQYPEALLIYSKLARQGVREAMYQYGDLALKGKNDEINCLEGIEWIKKAANKNYTPAKRTLGFLYMFSENEIVMMANDYISCPFKRDSILGAKFLIDAVSDGDTSAIRILEQMNKK